ncbi:hypothetical protein [Nocardioides sp.]|uniref:hypothetical protein n=1 Tax=Nocardioides sp. TaxID=35761 RepID=UPI002734C96E|nr:hypothetical protein [Nocardioides sp.]MDP3890051.1 hypothetical protein [Nocardioides sp.]
MGRLVAPLVVGSARAAVAVRAAGADVAPTAASLTCAFPEATDKIVLLVAAPGENDDCWDRHTDQVGAGYGERLARLLDWTPVRLRCEQRAADELAVELSSLLQRVVDGWPQEVSRMLVIGHGAGGLAVRAATAVRSHTPRPWQTLVSDVVLLETPLLAASQPRYAVPLGRRLEEQLGGITAVQPHCEPLAHTRYTAFTTRGPDAGNPVGRALGDLLWWRHRVRGRPRRAHLLFPTAAAHRIDAGDLTLANHPQVHRALVELAS